MERISKSAMNTDFEPLEIPVVPRPASRASLLLSTFGVCALATLVFAAVIGQEFPSAEDRMIIYIFAVGFGAFLSLVLYTYARQTSPPMVLRIEPDHLRLQAPPPGGELAIAYADLRLAHKEGRGDGENLVFKAQGERGPMIAVGSAFLPDGQGADAVLETVHRRISLLADGPQRLDGILALQAVAERISSCRRTAIFAVSALLILIFLAELATGALSDPFRLWAFGAGSYSLIKEGELFRLATANLLHGNALHLAFNLMVLYSMGSFLAPLLGTGRFLTLLMTSALAGAAGSAFLGQHELAVGASTGISGLIAAYVVVLWRWPDRLPNPPTRQTWIWIAAAFLLPVLFFDNIDHMAHLAGFLAGLALLLPETRGMDLLEIAGRRRALFRGSAALLGLLFLVAGWTAFRQAGGPERYFAAAAPLLRDPSVPPPIKNNLIWTLATNPATPRDQLAAALQTTKQLAESESAVSEIKDTHATVLYRLGRFEEAIQLERGLFDKQGTPFRASQLARFERALVETRGPLLLGQRPQALPQARIAADRTVLVDRGASHLLSGAILHLVLTRVGTPSAFLELQIGTDEKERILRHPLPQDLAPLDPDKVILTLVDLQNLENRSQETRWRLVAVEPETVLLP